MRDPDSEVDGQLAIEKRARTLVLQVEVVETLDGRMTEAYVNATWEDEDVTEGAEMIYWNPKPNQLARFVEPLVHGWVAKGPSEARSWCTLKGATVIRS